MKSSALKFSAALVGCALLGTGVETFGFTNLERLIGTQTMLLRHQATEEQKRVAPQRAQGYYTRLAPEKKAVLKKRQTRYLAVETVRSAKAPAKVKKTVMIWDTQAAALVSNDVYDLEAPPPIGQTAKFDTYAAEYVGRGG